MIIKWKQGATQLFRFEYSFIYLTLLDFHKQCWNLKCLKFSLPCIYHLFIYLSVFNAINPLNFDFKLICIIVTVIVNMQLPHTNLIQLFQLQYLIYNINIAITIFDDFIYLLQNCSALFYVSLHDIDP